MSTLTWITDKEQEREIKKKKTKETHFVGRLIWKFYSGGEKMRNASGHQGENERHGKKVNRTSYNISSIKRVTRKFWKFHVVVVPKKRVLHVQSWFFANYTY